MGNDSRQLSQAAVEAISSRLAQLPDLRLPAQLRREGAPPASTQRREEYLAKLLTHDPGERLVSVLGRCVLRKPPARHRHCVAAA